MKSCALCRHSRRTQTDPHFWTNSCSLMQAVFPAADDCGLYEPPPALAANAETGIGYVWDGEFEGPA